MYLEYNNNSICNLNKIDLTLHSKSLDLRNDKFYDLGAISTSYLVRLEKMKSAALERYWSDVAAEAQHSERNKTKRHLLDHFFLSRESLMRSIERTKILFNSN